MQLITSFLATASIALLLVQGAQAEVTSGRDLPQRQGYYPATDQHRVLRDCHYELGKQAAPTMQATYVAHTGGGDSLLRVLPDRHVTAEDAAWINACADRRLGRASAPAGPKPDRVGGNCHRHSEVLRGGSAYCIGY